MPNILIIVTGSVAALKLPLLVDMLLQQHKSPLVTNTNNNDVAEERWTNVSVRIVVTESSLHFFSLEEVQSKLPADSKVYRDQDEWDAWKKIGDKVLHIELRNWADIGVIAPLDANTLGKVANGICDNLATCVLRAWDMSKPLLFMPAMNVHMWQHPLTSISVETLRKLGYIQVGPISKKLACGDIGMGAMAEVDQIVQAIQQHLTLNSKKNFS